MVIAPNGVELERFASLPDPESARHPGLREAPTVLCAGHLYQGRGADLFLQLAKTLPDAHFVWVGGRQEDVAEWKAGPGSPTSRSRVLSRMPTCRATLPRRMCCSCPTRAPSWVPAGMLLRAVASPMKMFEYMAAGRAILTSDLPVLMAVFCPAEDIGAWTAALGSLLSDPPRRLALGERARAAVSKYAWIERVRRAPCRVSTIR